MGQGSLLTQKKPTLVEDRLVICCCVVSLVIGPAGVVLLQRAIHRHAAVFHHYLVALVHFHLSAAGYNVAAVVAARYSERGRGVVLKLYLFVLSVYFHLHYIALVVLVLVLHRNGTECGSSKDGEGCRKEEFLHIAVVFRTGQ